MRILRVADRVATPWKNGGGITFEVATFPGESGLDDFGWRISTAEVRTNGPFSTFPNIDRTLAIVEGRLLLDVAGQGVSELDTRSAAVVFPGDVHTSAKPLSAVVVDLNVMTRRGEFIARVSRPVTINRDVSIAATADVTVVFALNDINVRRGQMSQKLFPRDALLVTKDEHREVALAGPIGGIGPAYFLIEIHAGAEN
jgi:environmental stress-induced protein Ves